MTEAELQSLAERYVPVRPKPDVELIEAVDAVVCSNDGLQFVLRLIDRCEDEKALAYVAAGPLEDLLRYHGVSVTEELETLARRHAKVRRALGHVWLSEGDGAESWLRALLKRFGRAP